MAQKEKQIHLQADKLPQTRKSNTKNKWAGLLFILFIVILHAGCRSEIPETATPHENRPASPSAETTEKVTERVTVEVVMTVESTPSPKASPTLTPTLTPTPTSTPLDLSKPDYTLMGMELVGSNFVQKVPLAAEAGAGWVRWNGVLWANIEPQEGIRNWGNARDLEVRAQAVSEAGMNLIAIVRRTPFWAQSNPGYFCGPVKADKLEAFGNFMYDLVERYSQPPYNVKYWEMGNEPDIDASLTPADSIYGCWGDQDEPYYGGQNYAEMLKAVYPKIKAADPEAQVLVGGLLLDCDPINPPLLSTGEPANCSPSLFLQGILVSGGGDFFDGVSFHAYDFYSVNRDTFVNGGWKTQEAQEFRVPVGLMKGRYLKELLNLYGHSDKFLINTETALLCGRDRKEPQCRTETFELSKANYVLQSYAVAKAEGFRANIWYHYQQGWRASGLAQSNLQPLPGLTAFRFASQMLDASFYLAPVSDYPNVYGYKFVREGLDGNPVEFWILWSLNGEAVSLILPEVPDAIFNALGESLPVLRQLDVTVPVILEWNTE